MNILNKKKVKKIVKLFNKSLMTSKYIIKIIYNKKTERYKMKFELWYDAWHSETALWDRIVYKNLQALDVVDIIVYLKKLGKSFTIKYRKFNYIYMDDLIRKRCGVVRYDRMLTSYRIYNF